MTAHEQQDQRVVLIRLIQTTHRRRLLLVGPHLRSEGCFTLSQRQLAAHVIGHAAGGDLDQPSARVIWQAVLGPLHGGCEQRLLNRILGGCEVPEAPHDRAEHARTELPQQFLGRRTMRSAHHMSPRPLMIGRTSIGMFAGAAPGPGIADKRAAIS